MKKMHIKEIHYGDPLDIGLAEKILEQEAEYQLIESVNWPEYPYRPDVKFKIGFCQNHILLKYYVREENIKAVASKVNDDVYKDSCVEFFISTRSDKSYYNFEFSCIGIPNASFGSDRHKRELISPDILNLIQVKPSLGVLPFEEKTGGHYWELMLVIPSNCFVQDENLSLKSLRASANFYKCGDETSLPHFVSWNPIDTEKPNFHQPGFFGEIIFG